MALPSRTLVACGVSVAPFLREMLQMHPLPGVSVSVRPVENRFFGKSVTVSGLLVGADLLAALQGERGHVDRVLITGCMLKDGEDVFLDGMALAELEERLGIPVMPVGRTGDALLRALMGLPPEDDEGEVYYG